MIAKEWAELRVRERDLSTVLREDNNRPFMLIALMVMSAAGRRLAVLK